jgi:enoyl-CoA hydratase/carnithine racemase
MNAVSTAPAYETLEVSEPVHGVVTVTLNRPDQLNAMTRTMFEELELIARTLDRDGRCRVVLLTGSGRAFCAGYDLGDAGDLASLGAIGMLDLQERAARALLAIRSLRVPVVASIGGAAAGGGLALALAADIRIGGPRARFNAAFVRIGLSAGDLGTSWLLTRLIGPARTSEICFTGRVVEAHEAFGIGLLNEIADEPDLRARELAEEISGNASGGVQMSKKALRANLEVSSYAAAVELENRGQALLTQTDDVSEAIAAMRERRSPNFTGA